MRKKRKRAKKYRPPTVYVYNAADYPTPKKPTLLERIGSLLSAIKSAFPKKMPRMPRINFVSGDRPPREPTYLFRAGYRPYYGPTTVGGLFAFILFLVFLASVFAILNVTGVLK